jgi:hypothetical protein
MIVVGKRSARVPDSGERKKRPADDGVMECAATGSRPRRGAR